MTATLKIFRATTLYLPKEWRDVISEKHARTGAEIIITARVKRDTLAMLQHCGLDYGAAARIVDEDLRMQRPPHMWVPLREALAAGVVSTGRAEVHIFRRYASEPDPIIRVEPGGALTVAARFGRDRSRGRTSRGSEPGLDAMNVERPLIGGGARRWIVLQDVTACRIRLGSPAGNPHYAQLVTDLAQQFARGRAVAGRVQSFGAQGFGGGDQVARGGVPGGELCRLLAGGFRTPGEQLTTSQLKIAVCQVYHGGRAVPEVISSLLQHATRAPMRTRRAAQQIGSQPGAELSS